jgi:hypothetical protein
LTVKTRVCRKCGIAKPYSDYYANSKGSRRSTCADCAKKSSRVDKRTHPERTSATFKNWRDTRRGFALVNVARHRAKKRGLPCDLDPQNIQDRIETGFCELTGIPFALDKPRSWNAPSLDRIDSTKGYTRENTRVVLYALNVMANTWGPGRILEIAAAIVKRRKIASENLSFAIAEKFKEKTAHLGSGLYVLTWKTQVTPAGHLIPALVASAPRTSDSGCTGWPTPTKGNADGSQMAKDASPTGKRPDGSKATVSLPQVASFAGWPTPMAGSPATENYNEAGDSCNSRKTRLLVSGETPTGSSAPTEKRGQLNPGLSRWMQGLPPSWDMCALEIDRFSRRSSKARKTE